MLHVHHADETGPLLDALVELLATDPADPFAAEVVVVPTVGMADLVTAHLARRLGSTGRDDGVVAGIEFVFPGRFLARVLGDAGRPGDVSSDPWHVDRLTWSVLDELVESVVDVPGPSAGHRWRLARHIADLFDRYATQRPQVIAAWAAGSDTDGTAGATGDPMALSPAQRWQAELWRAVRRRIGVTGPAELHAGLLASLRRGDLTPDLPARVMVFGVGGFAPALLGVVRSLSEVRDVHVFWRHPSATAWATSPHALAGSLVGRAQLDVTTHVRHPLLASWARPALEARAVFGGVQPVVDDDRSRRPDPPSSLLGALQHGIRTDTSPTPLEGIATRDGSFQVHACHGMARQLEALRDALGHAFVADSTLAAHEVLVLCPDLERVAPLVEAVFARGSLPVPVRVGDRSLTAEDPLAAALIALLDLAASRASLSEVLSLVQRPAVRARLGWEAGHVEQLSEWCRHLGTRWGLEPGHRTDFGMPGDHVRGTWRAMVDRLAAGMLMAAPSPRRVVGDLSPFDDLGTDDHTLVGGLADLVARLGMLHDALSVARSVAAWIDLLHEVVDGFLAADEPWRRRQLHAALDDIAASACPPGAPERSCPVPIDPSDLRALLVRSLGERHGRLALRSGAVTVSSLVPQHGVPARVICLVGLDEGALGGRAFDGDDVLGEHPCVGERHPRHEQRQLLLDTVLSAGERLIITCDGSDLTTNAPLPFVVPLAELLDVVDRLVPGAGGDVVVRHPRHGFAESVLGATAGSSMWPAPFTFDPEMLGAATSRRAVRPVDMVDWRLADPVATGTVDIDALVEAVTRPERTYLRGRLGVRLPSDDDPIDDALPLDADGRHTASLGRDLYAARARGVDVDEWRAAADLMGQLPPGALGTAVVDAVVDEVDALWRAAATLGAAGLVADRVELGLDLEASGAAVRLEGVVRHVRRDAGLVVDVAFRKPSAPERLGLAVRLAALQVAVPEVPWVGVLVRRPTSVHPVTALLRLRGDDPAARGRAAQALLERALEVRAWALRDAVPLFPTASSAVHADPGARVAELVAADLDDTFADADLVALWSSAIDVALGPVLDTDPAGLDRGLGRTTATARWLWGVFDSAVDVEEGAAKRAGSSAGRGRRQSGAT